MSNPSRFSEPRVRLDPARLDRWQRIVRPAMGLLLLFCLATISTGCAKMWPWGGGFRPEPLLLVGFGTSNTVRVSDALIVEVVLISQSKKPLTLQNLSASSLTFWFSDETGRSFRRMPVVSPREDPRQYNELQPGDTWRRRFLFTQATETSGTLRVQAFYGALPLGGDPLPGGGVFSVPFTVNIRGGPAFQRDSAGVLLRQDAVRIARDWAGMSEESRADATLVRNEAGFLDWWVRLAPSDAAAYRKACLVNPYIGEVRAETDPTIAPPKSEDPALQVPPPRAPSQPLRDVDSLGAPQ